MSSLGDLGTKFPLHILVWKNDFRQLEEALEKKVKAGGGGEQLLQHSGDLGGGGESLGADGLNGRPISCPSRDLFATILQGRLDQRENASLEAMQFTSWPGAHLNPRLPGLCQPHCPLCP